jgi:hypothetical protein
LLQSGQMRQVVVLVPVRVSYSIIHPKYNNMLVDKRREEALKSLYYLGEYCSDKRDRCYGKSY